MSGFLYGVLLVSGSVATVTSAGLAVIHWRARRPRPLLDRDGWWIATYGTVALAVCDLVSGQVGWLTVGWCVGAVASAYYAVHASAHHDNVVIE